MVSIDESNFLKAFVEEGKGKVSAPFMFQYILQVESDSCILMSTVKVKSYLPNMGIVLVVCYACI